MIEKQTEGVTWELYIYIYIIYMEDKDVGKPQASESCQFLGNF